MSRKWLSQSKHQFGINGVRFVIRGLRHSLQADCFRRLSFPAIWPLIVLVGITYKCDSRCRTCGIWKEYLKKPEKVNEEMTLDEFRTFVAANDFLEDITLTGGEPFLREDLFDMWMYLDERGFRTGTTTNAIRADYIREKEEKLLNSLSGKNFHTLQISFDGLREKHDYMRGIPGNFDKAVGLLRWALKKEEECDFFETSISHTIAESNYGDFPEFIDYFLKLGLKTDQISFRICQQSSLYYKDTALNEIPIETSKIIEVIKQIQEKYYQNDLFINGIINCLKNPSKLVIPCYAAFTFCYIDPYWNVYPCISFDKKLGNLRDCDFKLKSIFSNDTTHKVREEIKKGNCPNCWSKCSAHPSMLSNTLCLLKLCWANKHRLLRKRT